MRVGLASVSRGSGTVGQSDQDLFAAHSLEHAKQFVAKSLHVLSCESPGTNHKVGPERKLIYEAGCKTETTIERVRQQRRHILFRK